MKLYSPNAQCVVFDRLGVKMIRITRESINLYTIIYESQDLKKYGEISFYGNAEELKK